MAFVMLLPASEALKFTFSHMMEHWWF